MSKAWKPEPISDRFKLVASSRQINLNLRYVRTPNHAPASRAPRRDSAHNGWHVRFLLDESGGIQAHGFINSGFDRAIEKFWDTTNKGRQWKDIRSKYVESDD
ncbi:hypothetical protein MMC06_003232 [Schaereria dolodes]|nr:hypothetical protein [Schaereria dolodes]